MCAETTTVNFGWTKADPGASSTTWGTTINATIDKIDQVAWGTQQAAQAAAPVVGSIIMFAGVAAPAGWLICDGRSLSTAAPYDKLFAVLQYAFGGSGANFNLPNLSGVFPLGAGVSNPVGQVAGSYSVSIAVGNLPSHAHPINDLQHNHVINQSTHSHPDFGHNHSINQSPHSHFNVLVASGVSGNVLGAVSTNFGGSGNTTSTTIDMSLNPSNANMQPANANITLNGSGTGLSTTQAVGSGTPLTIVPSYVALNFIVRFQ